MVKFRSRDHINQQGFKIKTVGKENLSHTSQTTLPRVLEPIKSSRRNQDIRMQLAYALFEEIPRGNVLLMGTPRSGRTTSVIAEACNRFEPVLVIEPLISIAIGTVVEAMGLIEPIHQVERNIIHIPSNRACKKIAEEIENILY